MCRHPEEGSIWGTGHEDPRWHLLKDFHGSVNHDFLPSLVWMLVDLCSSLDSFLLGNEFAVFFWIVIVWENRGLVWPRKAS